MVLQASGTISLGQIGAEFLDINPITLSEFYDADLGVPKITDPPNPGRAAPEISLSDFYGTRRVFTYSWNPSGTSITYGGASRTAVAVDNFDMLQAAVSAGWNGYSSLIWEINNNIMAYATSRVRPAMQIDYTSISYNPAGYGKRWPRQITIDNRGWIMGKGGNGSSGNSKGQDGGGALFIRGATGSIDDNEASSGTAGGTGLVRIQNTKAILGGGGGGNGGSAGVAGGGGGGAGGGSGGSKGSGGGGAGGGPFSSGNNGGAVASNSYRGLGGQAGGGGGGWDSRGKSSDAYGGGGGGGRVPATSASGGTAGSGGGAGGSYSALGGNGGDGGGGGGYGKGGGTSGSQGSRSGGGYAISVPSGLTQYVPVGSNFQLEGRNDA